MKYQLVIVLLLSVSLSQGCGGCDYGSCIIFLWGNNCSSCQANYYLNPSSNQCIACLQNYYSSAGSTSVSDCIYNCSLLSGCSTCINSTSCSLCSQNYYMIRNGICSSCPPGQYTPPNHTLLNCLPCKDQCYSCSGTSNNCLSCPADYYLDITNSTCIPCPVGYYQLVQNTATSCINCLQSNTGCATCTGGSDYMNCTTCYSGSYLFFYYQISNGGLIFQCQQCYIGQYTPPDSALTSCLQCPLPYCYSCNSTACLTCPEGYYLNGPQCIPCVIPCQLCTNASVCYSCIIPGALNGTSCVTCPQSTYLVNGTCQNCPTGCYACGLDDLGSFGCYTCIANYQFTSDQECQSCQSEANCPVCPFSCQTCSQNGSCLTCSPPFFQSLYYCAYCPQFCLQCLNQLTCTSCSLGYLYEGSCMFCQATQSQNFCCPLSCQTCLNNTACLTCDQGYYMVQDYICIACPFGQTNPSDNNNTNCSLLNCPTNCSSCYAFLQSCFTCIDGYILNANSGQCTIDSTNNTSNDTSNDSSSNGLSQSTIIVLSTVIPVCVLVIIGIIVYCVIKKKKQSTIGTTDKPRTSDVEIGDRKYFKLTETNLAVQ